MLVNFESKLIFIHIPKTAGSTICSTLDNWHGLGGFSNAHTSVEQIKENMDTEGFKFVTFIRDPYGRFKSLYNFLLLNGKVHDTPLSFASNIFTGKYGWSFTNPMCYFCRKKDLADIGRVENFKEDFKRIFGQDSVIVSKNKTERPDIYVQFPQLRQMVTRIYFEDFVEFQYPMETFIYKQVLCEWTIKDLKINEKKTIQDEYSKTGSIFDKVPLTKMIP